jgi:general secretion pathway protein L
MAERLFVKMPAEQDGVPTHAARYEWRVMSADGEWVGEVESGTLTALSETLVAARNETDLSVCLLISGSKVSVRRLPITDAEKRHMQNLLPYQLEEEVACDVEQLHFAYGTPSDDAVSVAYVDRQWFAELLQTFADADVDLDACLPEAQLLFCEPGACTLSLDDELVVHAGNGFAFSLDRALLEPGLHLLETLEPTFDTLTLIAPSEDQLQDLEQKLSDSQRDKVEHRFVRDAWGALNIEQGSMSLNTSATYLNLCAGEFAQRLPIGQWWLAWRKLAVFSAVVLAVFLLVNFLHVQQLKSAQAEMQKDIESAFRSVVPRGAMVDPLRQLKAKMKGLSTVAEGSESVWLISLVSPHLQAAGKVKLQGFQYNHERNELRLNVQAPTFNDIERLRAALDGGKVKSTLMNASAQAGVHSARIKVEKLR